MSALDKLNDKPLFKLIELSRVLQISVTTLQKWIKKGEFPGKHTEHQYSAEEVKDWYFRRGNWSKEERKIA